MFGIEEENRNKRVSEIIIKIASYMYITSILCINMIVQ